MALNKSKGNMYSFVTHTWNTIKGECPHACTYCYMKRWKNQKPVRFDAKELKTDLGKGNFIFVGSSCDMFAKDINADWISQTLWHCNKYPDNKYLFQTKNPERLHNLRAMLPKNSVVCTTLETNKQYPLIMQNSPHFEQRVAYMHYLKNDFLDNKGLETFVTIEPIMDFDILVFVENIKRIAPTQVNIGADSGNNNLPEPSKEKILELIKHLEVFTKVVQKKNLKRLLK